MSDVQNQSQPEVAQKPMEIVVPIAMAVNIKVLEFDKQIAEVEAQVAELKKQKISFIYDSNMQELQRQYQQQQAKDQQPAAEEVAQG